MREIAWGFTAEPAQAVVKSHGMSTTVPSPGRFRRIEAPELRQRIAGARPPLLLDVRRRGAFHDPPGIPGALPFALDREPVRLPRLPRDHPLVAYCL